jgi:hypothetical protein
LLRLLAASAAASQAPEMNKITMERFEPRRR